MRKKLHVNNHTLVIELYHFEGNYELDYPMDDFLVIYVDGKKVYDFSINDLWVCRKVYGRRGLFPSFTRGERKKYHARLRRLLGISKKEYCKVMGYVGNLLSPYLRSANF